MRRRSTPAISLVLAALTCAAAAGAARAAGAAPDRCRVAAYRLSARASLEIGDYASAAAALRRILGLDPYDLVALRQLAEIRPQLPGEAFPREDILPAPSPQGKTPNEDPQLCAELAAQSGFQPLDGKAPRLIDKYVAAAMARIDIGDDAAARASLKRALALKPDREQSLAAVSLLNRDRDHSRYALDLASRLVALSKKLPAQARAQAYRAREQVFEALHDEAGAQADAARVLQLFPDDLPSLRSMLESAPGQNRTKKALDLATRLVAASEKFPAAERAEAYRSRAQALLALNERAAAVEDLRMVLRLSPADVDALWTLWSGGLIPAGAREPAPWLVLRATVLAGEDKESSREALRQAGALDPKTACFDGLLQKNRSSLDAAYFTACLERFPRDEELYVGRGVARFLSGDAARAAEDFRKALALKPDDAQARLSLAAALETQAAGANPRDKK